MPQEEKQEAEPGVGEHSVPTRVSLSTSGFSTFSFTVYSDLISHLNVWLDEHFGGFVPRCSDVD